MKKVKHRQAVLKPGAPPSCTWRTAVRKKMGGAKMMTLTFEYKSRNPTGPKIESKKQCAMQRVVFIGPSTVVDGWARAAQLRLLVR